MLTIYLPEAIEDYSCFELWESGKKVLTILGCQHRDFSPKLCANQSKQALYLENFLCYVTTTARCNFYIWLYNRTFEFSKSGENDDIFNRWKTGKLWHFSIFWLWIRHLWYWLLTCYLIANNKLNLAGNGDDFYAPFLFEIGRYLFCKWS